MFRTTASLAGIVCIAAVAVSGNRTLADHAFVRVMGDWEKSDGGKSLEQHFRFANDLAAYGLTYTIAIAEGTPPGKCTSPVWAFKTKDVTLGMSAPAGANWYTQAFSSVRIDGLSLHDIPGTFRIVRADGDDALVEGLWDTPKCLFSMRLLLRAGDDKLLVQYVLPSENSGKQLDVCLVAYPHGFQKPWDRHMATATRDIGQQSGVVLDPAMERWALFYDEGMWKTKAGGGPCGFVYAPDEVEPPRVTVGPYSVAVHLRTKPEVRRMTVGLWDFTTTPDVAAVRSYLRNGGEKISDDVAALANTDWLAGVVRPAQLPKPRREELTQLVAERRKPTPYDTMTAEIATPHVAWAKPLPDGPVRTLVVCPRWYQRETVELAQRLDLDCQTVSLAGPDELFNATWLYLYGSYDAYGYKRKTEIDVLDELNRAIRADRDCIMLSGFKPQILPASLRRALMEKTRGGSGLVLLGDCRVLLKEFGDSLQPASWDPGIVPFDRLPGLNQMVAEDRPLWRAYQCGRGRVLALDYNTGNSSTRLAFTPGLTHEDPDVLAYYDYYHSLLAAGVMWAARRQPDVQIRFHPKPGQITIESAGTFAGAMLEAIAHDPSRRCRERTSRRIDLRQGENEVALPMTGPLGGPRFVNVCAKHDDKALGWGTAWWDVPCDSAQLKNVKLQETSIEVGDTVVGSVELTQDAQGETIELELWDTVGRCLERQQLSAQAKEVPFRFTMNSSWYWTSFNTGPALLFPDLRPTPQFLWMQESLAEIKAGIGRLLLAAERQHDGIAVHYSQASVHAGTLTGRRLEHVQWGFMRLVEDLGLQYQVLSYEQIEQGQLDDYRVLLLPASAALSPHEAAAIRQFTEQGGLVIADTLPGWLDHHCHVLDKGLLDDLFGVRRAGVPKRDGNAAIQVSMKGLDGDLQLQIYDAGLQAETATAWAAGGDVPAVFVRDVGKGRTVVLNADIGQYESLRSTGKANPVRRLTSHLLEQAGVRPQARVVDKQGHLVSACEVVRFADAGLSYVAVVSDHRLADVKTQDVSIHLPAQAVVYDIRTRELLGNTKVVQRTLVPGDPLVLALMPYVVERPIIEPEARECAPGQVSQFVVRLSLRGQATGGHHCLRVEAISPDGSCRRCDTQNVLTSQNKTAVSIPLPLNTPAGAWKLRVTDVASGKAATAKFRVDPR